MRPWDLCFEPRGPGLMGAWLAGRGPGSMGQWSLYLALTLWGTTKNNESSLVNNDLSSLRGKITLQIMEAF